MDNIVDIGMLREDLVQGSFVGDVCLVEDGPLAGKQLNTVENLLVGVIQAINDNNFVSGFEKGEGCERANVASTTAPVSIDVARVQKYLWRAPDRADALR